MLPPLEYLRWARQFYGQVELDLATSGLQTISASDLLALASPRDPMKGGLPASAPAPDDLGHLARFQRAVARRYGVDESTVVPCLGTSGGLFLLLATLLDRGDEVLVEDPTYEPVRKVPVGLGLSVRTFARVAANQFSIVVERVVEALGPETRAVVVTNPHNPSGAFTDDATLAALAEKLAHRNVLLIVDEVYRELVAPGTTVQRIAPNVRTTSSLTKAFGLAWARAGWAMVAPGESETATNVLTHVCGVLPPSGAGFGAFALDHAAKLEERRETMQAGKRTMIDAFAERVAARFAWSAPPREMLFGLFVDRQGADLFPEVERLIRDQKLLVAPGTFFGLPSSFRLSWTAPAAKLQEGLERLGRALSVR